MAEQTWLDGLPASAGDLRALALSNYGHFTVMVVRQGAVQGLAFHLQRLQAATRALFDTELDAAALCRQVHAAAAQSPAGCVARVTVFARGFDYRQPLRAAMPSVLVTLAPVPVAAKPPIRVIACRFTRPFPEIKHVGTFAQHHWRRRAQQQGGDDALFVDGLGHVSEGTNWNIGFWDGQGVVWPQADALRGSSEHVLQQALAEAGLAQQWRPVSLQEALAFPAAFACNATGLQAVAAIDGRELPADAALMARLGALLSAQPWQALA